MRDLKRNQQTIYYALRNVAEETDEWGNTIDVKGYGEPTPLKISVSANRGEASLEAFGTDLKYDREMSTHDINCPIDEYTHLWVDNAPLDEPYNYKVVAVSKSLNNIRYAIRKVIVSQ